MQCVWTCILCISGSYGQLLDYIIFAVLVFYILTIAGLFVLRVKRPDEPRPYRAFGYPVLPATYIRSLEDPRHRVRHLLQPHAQRAVDQGRDLRQPAEGRDRAGRLRPRHHSVPGGSRGKGRSLPHRRAYVLQHRTGSDGRCAMKLRLGIPQRQPARRDAGAAGAGRVAGVCESAIVFRRHQRSGNRVHADSGAGDGALRGARRARCRPDRLRLGHGERVGSRHRGRPDLRQAEPWQGALGAGGAGRFASAASRGLARRNDRDRVGERHQPLLRSSAVSK